MQAGPEPIIAIGLPAEAERHQTAPHTCRPRPESVGGVSGKASQLVSNRQQPATCSSTSGYSHNHPRARLLNKATATCCCHILFSPHLNAQASGRGVGRNQGQAQLRRPPLRPCLQVRQARQARGSVASSFQLAAGLHAGAVWAVAWLHTQNEPLTMRSLPSG